MAKDSASPTTDCIASVVSLGVHVIGRKRQVDCDGQKAGRKDALIGPLGGPSSYRPLSGRYLILQEYRVRIKTSCECCPVTRPIATVVYLGRVVRRLQ